MKKLYIDNQVGIFLGRIHGNLPHDHLATQISIGLDVPVRINSSGRDFSHGGLVIRPNVTHSILSQEIQITILINPSTLFNTQVLQIDSQSVFPLSLELTNLLQSAGKQVMKQQLPFAEFIKDIKVVFQQRLFPFLINHEKVDERIVSAMNYMEVHHQELLTSDQVAAFCHLSTSRFLHLFKENTGINFRRAQLWWKISKSIP